MNTVRERAMKNAAEITSMLVVGLGLLALFTGWSPVPFWVIFAVGFAVVVPIVAILVGDDDKSEWNWWHQSNNDWTGNRDSEKHPDEPTTESSTDALSTLRDRYARGELTDDQFEHKLDALLETESPENAAEWRTRERERIEERS